MVGAAAAPRPQEPLQIEPRDPGDGVDGAGLGSRGAAGWKGAGWGIILGGGAESETDSGAASV